MSFTRKRTRQILTCTLYTDCFCRHLKTHFEIKEMWIKCCLSSILKPRLSKAEEPYSHEITVSRYRVILRGTLQSRNYSEHVQSNSQRNLTVTKLQWACTE